MSKETTVNIDGKEYTLGRIKTLKAFEFEGRLLALGGRGLAGINSLDDHMAALASRILQDFDKEQTRNLVVDIVRESVKFPTQLNKETDIKHFWDFLDSVDDGLGLIHELFAECVILSFGGLVSRLKKKFTNSTGEGSDFLSRLTGES